MPRPSVAPEVKARAIADLMDGAQPAIVAARYGVPSGTVRSWKVRLDLPVASNDASNDATVIRKPAIELQQIALGDLILANLRAKLTATQKIAEYVTTPEWIEKQNAADMGALFEALDRSAVGILDRMARGARADDPNDRAGDAA